MIQNQINNSEQLIVPEIEVVSATKKPFIEANTKAVKLVHLKKDCTIPVFSKDNECTIAHQEFIDIAQECASNIFSGHSISLPEVRVSHVVKGRIPSAIGKPVKELLEHEKTIYYERMMFAIEIPTISENVYGQSLKLTIGGVRAYNQENLYSKKSIEKFKFFIGFKNMVCCNLCVSSDGYVEELKVSSVLDLKNKIMELIGNYSMQTHLNAMRELPNHSLTEKQFAQFLGRCRLYNYLSKEEKAAIPLLSLTDGQLNMVARDYYQDESFCKDQKGNINMWKLFNLLTGANKSSYIDSFLGRNVNAFEIVQSLGNSIKNKERHWFLN
ncbi:DUF3871 family protein [Pseudotamlana carrageenivorans]|uniref:DUF3871 domain-containing protein n=1 Tax=Pseudotamlana carrageenivorans TaxID=2069432 RepID=A0A2I7SGU8_9FLAO|nr:DUF3871 family protein [Tamlana carrageenivorans]AUS05121.1 hypothetical protein C1A40_06400 [Tamlana carrageenivorans]